MKEKKTFSQWLENFWYHYKWWVVFAVFLLTLVISGIYFGVTDNKYDYNFTYVTYSTTSATQMEEFEDEIKKYAQDVDGDGEININVQYYNMDIIAEDPNGYAANIVGIQDDINNARSTIFILDEEAFNFIQEHYKCFGNPDGSYAEQSMNMEKLGWNWSGTALYGKMSYYGFPEDLYFVVRTLDNTKFEGKEKQEKSSADSIALFERIKEANPKESEN